MAFNYQLWRWCRCNGNKYFFASWIDRKWRSFPELQQPCFVIAFSNIQSLHLDLKPTQIFIFNSHIYFRRITDSPLSADHFEQMSALCLSSVCEAFFSVFFICICSWLQYNLTSELVCLRNTCSFTPALLNSLITLSICAWISLRALKNPSAGL